MYLRVDGKINHLMKWMTLVSFENAKGWKWNDMWDRHAPFPLENDTLDTLGHIVVFIMVLKSLNKWKSSKGGVEGGL